jgi:hypothetical protein
METQIIRNENKPLREYLYRFSPVEGNISVSNKKKEGSSRRGGLARDTAYGNKPALLPKGSVRPDEQKAIAPIKSSLTKQDRGIIFLNKESGLKDAFNSEKTPFTLNISSEAVTDQYAMGRVVLNVADQRIFKYREAQAYRLLPEPILEIYA